MLLSSAHHPQHDGQTEIVNKQLEIMLRAYVGGKRNDWAQWLPLLEHAYNSSVHTSTGASPFSLLYGYEPRSPLDYLTEKAVRKASTNRGSEEFVQEMRMHRDGARLAIAKAQVKQALAYNKGRRILDFKEGDLVLVNPHTLEWAERRGDGAKLVQRWIGPFEVQQKINENTYRLRMDATYPGHPIFNIQHLKRYQVSPSEYLPRGELPATRVLKPAQQEYEVESIVGDRFNKRLHTNEYLLRWKGYNSAYDTWEPERNLRNAPELLFNYRRSRAERP